MTPDQIALLAIVAVIDTALHTVCPVCRPTNGWGHTATCRLSAALAPQPATGTDAPTPYAALRGLLKDAPIEEGVDPAKCDHDTRCSRCGTRWPPQAEVIRDRQAIAAAMEDTIEPSTGVL